MSAAWIAAYIGIPWETLSCWELVRRVLAEKFGVTAPSYLDQYGRPDDWDRIAATVRDVRPEWVAVAPDAERPGDVIILRLRGHPIHVGIVIEPGDMLHSAQGMGACVESYRGLRWKNRIVGVYRSPELAR